MLQTHYNNAILESMKYWGVADAEAADISCHSLLWHIQLPGEHKEKIGNQKWLGLFDRGVEAGLNGEGLISRFLILPMEWIMRISLSVCHIPYNENKMNHANYDLLLPQ